MMDNCEEGIYTNTKPISANEIIEANIKLKDFFDKQEKQCSYTIPFSGRFPRETIYLEPVKIPFFIDIDKINKEPVIGLKANDIIID